MIPPESYIGAVVGSRFCLKGLIRYEHHGEVYAAEDLFCTNRKYEVKVYKMRELPPKLCNSHREDIRRLSQKGLIVRRVQQNGDEYIITRAVSAPVPATKIEIKARAQLGAIGRRNTIEFDQAFPRWPYQRRNEKVIPSWLGPPELIGCMRSAAHAIAAAMEEPPSAKKSKTPAQKKQVKSRQKKARARKAAENEITRRAERELVRKSVCDDTSTLET